MKKILTLLVLLLILVGCQKTENNISVSDNNQKIEQNNQSEFTKMYLESFENSIENANKIEEIADNLINLKLTNFDLVPMSVEPGYLNGFTKDITSFDHGVMMSPLIGTIPFVSYVFVTSDAESLVKELSENYDLRWNICTEAENFGIASYQDYVFVIMCNDDAGV